LINFETVKYFNAEDHEERRFNVALLKYRVSSVIVTNSMVLLNML